MLRGWSRPAIPELLGPARLEIGRRCGLIDQSASAFLWVVERRCSRRPTIGSTSVRRPFTAPLPDPPTGSLLSPAAPGDAYDIVCNGYEIAAGRSVSTRSSMQQQVFDVIGLSPDEARSQFGFLLDGSVGPPPHGGIAFGWDRVVMLLAGAETIRDVIAFPRPPAAPTR